LKLKKKLILFLIIHQLITVLLFSYPQIKQAVTDDVSFTQFRQDRKEFQTRFNSGKKLLSPSFYKYKTLKQETPQTLARQFNISIESLATLNGWMEWQTINKNTELLLPSSDGLYLNENKIKKGLGALIARSRKTNISLQIDKKKFFYYPGEKFTENEIQLFMKKIFLYPVKGAIVSSPYGYRVHPFNHKWLFHKGMDFALPSGSPVYAPQGGKVKETGTDYYLGRYLLIEHSVGWFTFYGHLRKTLVESGEKVYSGDLIAQVGNTGVTTGSHLHFEIRHDGHSLNPEKYLQRE